MMNKRLFFAPFALMGIFGQTYGSSSPPMELKLPTFWDSHMVLQREPMSAVIWGWNAPGSNVTVAVTAVEEKDTFGVLNTEAHVFSIANEEGMWSVDLPPQPAGAGYSIHISDEDSSIVLEDVAFGDVYLCSGQSNMQMSINATFNATAEIADSIHYPNLRLATVDLVTADTPQDDAPSKANYIWARSSPEALLGGGFEYYSATCYYFGRYLYKAMGGKVPIGLLTSCWGGQKVETFSSPDALADQSCGGTRPVAVDSHSNHQNETIDVIDGPKSTQLWNAMIHPLLKMRFSGAVWYQGEANAQDPISYACRFPAMITDWRKKFSLELPFFFVQLAAFPTYDYSFIRAAQLAATQLPKVGFATAIDIGDPSSPAGSVHPRRKQEVGRRLSLVVRSIQYKERGGLVASGPVLSGVQFGTDEDGLSTLQLSFQPGTADGLHAFDAPECTTCCMVLPFHVLDMYGKWRRVESGTVVGSEVHLEMNTSISGIRYAWDPYPECNLYNGRGGPDDHEGIAAAPFEWCAYPSGSPSWSEQGCRVPIGVETFSTTSSSWKI